MTEEQIEYALRVAATILDDELRAAVVADIEKERKS